MWNTPDQAYQVLALCTAKHTWRGSVGVLTIHLWARTADECTDKCAPPVLSCLVANLQSRSTYVHCTNESSLIFYYLTCKNLLRSVRCFLCTNGFLNEDFYMTWGWFLPWTMSVPNYVCPITMTTWNTKTNTFESGRWYWLIQILSN